jgi:hypothetical protein
MASAMIAKFGCGAQGQMSHEITIALWKKLVPEAPLKVARQFTGGEDKEIWNQFVPKARSINCTMIDGGI